MDDLTSMWESCDSQVVQSPMAAVDTALVIVGNDKVCSTFRDSSVLSANFPIAWRNLRDVRRFRANGRLTVVFLGRRSRQMPRYRRIHDLIFILLRRTHRQRPRIFIKGGQPVLTSWVTKYYDLGPETPPSETWIYAPMFELMLRLKSDYF